MKGRALLVPTLCLATACAGRRAPEAPSSALVQEGLASWYGIEERGRATASGEIMDPERLTAAHRTWPFGTVVHVEDIETRASVVVRINDRGPFIAGRIIDLSHRAARELGMVGKGVAKVRIRVLESEPGELADHRWRVQTGAFLEQERARDMARRLEQEGYHPVRISEHREGGLLYFRVWVGEFDERAQADELARSFRRAGRPVIVILARDDL